MKPSDSPYKVLFQDPGLFEETVRLVDAAALSAEDGRVNPAAALLRLQRCRRPAQLPGLTAALFGALRREGLRLLAEQLWDVLMHMLVERFGGDETGERHERELRLALRNMEEPTMLAERVTQWRQEALDEGRRQGVSEGMPISGGGGGCDERRLAAASSVPRWFRSLECLGRSLADVSMAPSHR